MRVGSAGEYESFEHVQKLCVASTNEFHSCLCVLRICSYRVCLTAYMLYSSYSHCIRTVFWLFLLYTGSFVHVGGTGADTNGPDHSTNEDGMFQRLLQSTYSCLYSCSYSCYFAFVLHLACWFVHIRTIFLLNSVHSCLFVWNTT